MRAVFWAAAASTRGRHTPSRRWLAAGTALFLVTCLGLASTATAERTVSAENPSVISDWNAIAVSTFSADPTKVPQETPLYTAFVQAAVYNAVVGIDGRYEPYRFDARARRGASVQAAAVAAAYNVVVTYSPYAKANLDAAYATSLAQIPDGKAKNRGIAFGSLAAADLIAMRANDGRNAPIFFTQAPAPGVWRPTPPGFLPMAVPWMGAVTPLLLSNGAQFDPGPPPALTSDQYTRDFNEVKAFGSATSTVRTQEQTSTALFFSGNAAVQYNAALRDQMTVRHPDIVDAARMFAAVDMSEADAIISVWHAKYLYGFWRPITAIQLADTDGNPATIADPSWTPLLTTTPPYPEYVSGYSGLTGAFTSALADTLDTEHLQLTLISTAVPGAVRQYDTGASLRDDVINARVWLGIHFRSADTGGVDMGQRVADWALDHYFGPREHRDRK